MVLKLTIDLPNWLTEMVGSIPKTFPTEADRMRFVITLARKNVEERTGDPLAQCDLPSKIRFPQQALTRISHQANDYALRYVFRRQVPQLIVGNFLHRFGKGLEILEQLGK